MATDSTKREIDWAQAPELTDEEKEHYLLKGQRIARAEKYAKSTDGYGSPPVNGEYPASLQDILVGRNPAILARIDKMKAVYQKLEDEINNSIDEKHKQIGLINTTVKEKTNEIDDQKKNIPLKKEELGKLVNDLYRMAESLGPKKKDLIHKRLQEFDRNIKKLIEDISATEATVNTKLKEDFEKDRSYNSEAIKYYNWQLDEVYVRQKPIKELVGKLHYVKLNSFLMYVLLSIATIAVLMAGNLLAIVFSNNPGNALETENLLSQAVTAISNLSAKYSPLYIITGFLVFLILNVAVSRLCDFLRDFNWKRRFKRTRINIVNTEAGQELQIREPIEDKPRPPSSNWLSNLLKFAPIAFFIIVSIAIITMGSSTMPVSPIDIANGLAGTLFTHAQDKAAKQALGSAICIILAGVVFMYIKLHVMPRFLKQVQENQRHEQAFFMKYEVVGIVLLFSLFFVGAIGCIWPIAVSQRVMMILGYIGCNFAGAILLAWIYFSRSVAIDEYNCSEDVAYWKKAILKASFATTYSFTPSENLLRTIDSGLNDIENLFREQMASLHKMLTNSNGKITIRSHDTFSLESLISNEELNCLPEIEKDYQILVTKMNELKKEIAKLEDLDASEIRESEEAAQKEEKIQQHLDEIEDLIEELSKIQERKERRIEALESREEHIRHWLQKGYESCQQPPSLN
jgi:hypothetical protein